MLREKLFDLVKTYGGRPTGLLIFLALCLVLPAVFYRWLARFSRDDFQGADRDGLAIGLAVATWASACWLLLPYFGVYPNLPSYLLLAIAFGFSLDTWWKELLVIGMNFVVWPLAGRLFFRLARTEGDLGPDIPDAL